MDLNYYIQYYVFYLESKFLGYPFIIRLTVLLISILLLIYFFSLIRFLAINWYYRVNEKRKNRIESKMGNRINDIIFDPYHHSKEEIAYSLADSIKLVKRRRDKLIFTDIIIDLLSNARKSNQTINQNNVQTLIQSYGIPEFWENELKSGSSKKRREALRKLDDLGNGFTGAIVMRSVYHKDKGLRKHARAAVMQYDTNDPFKFLEESFDSDFNALDEVIIHHFLTSRSKSGPLPMLTRYVRNSNNDAFKAFIIKEIGFFNQVDSAPILSSMLEQNSSNAVKIAIIETLGKLNYGEAEQQLIGLYDLTNKDVQKSIIHSIAQFKTDKGLEYLTGLYMISYDKERKIDLAYCIQQFGNKGNQVLKSFATHANGFDKKVFDQVTYHTGT
ncbi:HEAT repeat domain-containing protein [Sphingobacterium humi]|uniref:HEAT repeat domain-containing protein n=1 Tax=Sphingobacterium humi TaxID=1796905 RepID=A0A6N8L7H8_9SPHI|nr:HEAT repeat domain-containing protein [Sphingobacterium humi]MVZ64138.1 hypothetical protein [Sphingobacterium humi]